MAIFIELLMMLAKTIGLICLTVYGLSLVLISRRYEYYGIIGHWPLWAKGCAVAAGAAMILYCLFAVILILAAIARCVMA